jgi:hypothetical protein
MQHMYTYSTQAYETYTANAIRDNVLKWFCDTFTGAATGAAHCGSFVGGLLNVSYG